MSFFAGFYVSPVGRAHYLDTSGHALCGRYSPEPHDRRKAAASDERCSRCVLLTPRPEPVDKANHRSPVETRVRNQNIRDARKSDPEVSIEALAERYDCSNRLVRLALKRVPRSTRFASERAS